MQFSWGSHSTSSKSGYRQPRMERTPVQWMSRARHTQRTVSLGESILLVSRLSLKEPWARFYKGMSSPLVGVTPMFAVSFWGYAMGKKIVYAATGGDQNRVLTIGELAIAGALSAVPMAYVAAPVERVKVLMQASADVTFGIDCKLTQSPRSTARSQTRSTRAPWTW